MRNPFLRELFSHRYLAVLAILMLVIALAGLNYTALSDAPAAGAAPPPHELAASQWKGVQWKLAHVHKLQQNIASINWFLDNCTDVKITEEAQAVLAEYEAWQKKGYVWSGKAWVAPGTIGGVDSSKLDAQALRLIASGEFARAFTAATKAQSANPRDVDPWLILGVIADCRGLTPQAETYFRKALKLSPQDPIALNNMAVIFHERGLPRAACIYYLRAVRIGTRKRQILDNVFSFLHYFTYKKASVYDQLRTIFRPADADLHARMRHRGLVRYGATWVTAAQAPLLAAEVSDYKTARATLILRYSKDEDRLAVIKAQMKTTNGRMVQLEEALRVDSSDVNAGQWQQELTELRTSILPWQQEQKLAEIEAIRLLHQQASNLMQTATGQAYTAPERTLLPNGDTVSPVAAPANSFVPAVSNIASAGATPASLNAADIARAAAVQKAKTICDAATNLAWAGVLAADAQEVTALRAAGSAAMKAGSVAGVVAAAKLRRQVQSRLVQEKAGPPFGLSFGFLGDPPQTVPAVKAAASARAAAVAQCLKQSQAALGAYRAAVIQADADEVAAIKTSIHIAMKAGDTSKVVSLADALAQAKGQYQADGGTAMPNAAASGPTSSGAGAAPGAGNLLLPTASVAAQPQSTKPAVATQTQPAKTASSTESAKQPGPPPPPFIQLH